MVLNIKHIEFCIISSRALRSLPLSVMMSGNLNWNSGNLVLRGTGGYLWSSTPYAYINSRYLYFYSSVVGPKDGSSKPYGLALRCVARFLCAFPSRALRSLPLSVMMSGVLYWVNGILGNRGTNGYFWSSTPGSYTYSRLLYLDSAHANPKDGINRPYGLALRCVARIFRLCYNSYRHPCAGRSRKFYFRI